MTLFATVAALVCLQPAPVSAPVKLARKFTAGQMMRYDVRAELQSESREFGLQTWIPEALTIQYQFEMAIQSLKADGIAAVRYKRPTMTEIQSATFDEPEKRKVEKINFDLLLDLSPLNQILNSREMAPPKPAPKPAPKPNSARPARTVRGLLGLQDPAEAAISQFIGQFVSEVYRLSLFVGPLDGSMDLSPRFPLDAVNVGDTWKETVSYAPQALRGKDGELAVQRLDYTYTYRGLVTSNNRQVHRVTSELTMSTDLAAFLHQMTKEKPETTGLKAFPLNLKAHIEYDLEPGTFHTLRAVATSEGGFNIQVTEITERPVVEQRLKGRTLLRLLPATPAKK